MQLPLSHLQVQPVVMLGTYPRDTQTHRTLPQTATDQVLPSAAPPTGLTQHHEHPSPRLAQTTALWCRHAHTPPGSPVHTHLWLHSVLAQPLCPPGNPACSLAHLTHPTGLLPARFSSVGFASKCAHTHPMHTQSGADTDASPSSQHQAYGL